MKRSHTLIACIIVAAISITATAGAANRYLITSAKQIKPSVRHALKGAKGARGPEGDPGHDGTDGIGLPGAAGPAGPAGPAAVSRLTHVSNTVAIGPDQVQLISVACPAGQSVVSGGFGVVGFAFLSDGVGGTWSAGVDTYGNTSTYSQTVYANCAASGQAVAARAVDRFEGTRRYARLLAERRAQHR
ncbi:hypothetical protein DSM104299_00979 [Baekduia alba]|uniref:hypothetical protein n=1 Tax=Baekduia alba TaxID=2997333 RepID=UPI0023419994|nr:hypothetical protein [Baekduia alba]WCB92289.1 hypothetical protein DSM104299_00979 [Baekduia alba]